MPNRKKVIIIGSGLTGSLLAIFLARRNYDIKIFEKRSNIKNSSPDKKRTIAMSISCRGWTALEAVGLDTKLKKMATATYGRITYKPTGDNYKQHYGNEDEAIYTLDRKILNTTLIDEAISFENCRIYYDSNLEFIDFDKKTLNIDQDGKLENHSYDYLFATDGIFSQGRSLYENFLNISSQIEQLPIGYKEFTIPYTAVEKLNWDKSFIHVWPADSANFVGLPSDNKQAFMGNLFCSNEWVDFFNSSPTKEQVTQLLVSKFPLLLKVLKDLEDFCFKETSANIYMARSQCWNYQDNFLMLGDSIHGMAPFYAMGMNICFEDCTMFDQLLTEKENDLSKTIESFQEYRKKDVDAMQNIALENFHNLSKSSQTWFDQEWKLDRLLTQYCPKHWASESALISFYDIPVSEVQVRVDKQRSFIKENNLTYKTMELKTSREKENLFHKLKTTIENIN